MDLIYCCAFVSSPWRDGRPVKINIVFCWKTCRFSQRCSIFCQLYAQKTYFITQWKSDALFIQWSVFRFLRTKRIRIKQRKFFLFTHVAASNCTAVGDSYTSTYLLEGRFILKWLKGYQKKIKHSVSWLPKCQYWGGGGGGGGGEGWWSSGAMVLGKLPVPGRRTLGKILELGPTALAVGADGVVLTFLLPSVFYLRFLPHFGRRPDIEWNTVSKGY